MTVNYYTKEWGLPKEMVAKEIIKKYLGIQHDYYTNNCFSIINKIYKDELNKPLIDTLDRLDTDLKVSKFWHKKFTTQIISKETEYFKQINLPDLESFDIILFKDKKGRIVHFGMYISGLEFFHLQEDSQSRLETLDDYWKGRIYGCYRKV